MSGAHDRLLAGYSHSLPSKKYNLRQRGRLCARLGLVYEDLSMIINISYRLFKAYIVVDLENGRYFLVSISGRTCEIVCLENSPPLR